MAHILLQENKIYTTKCGGSSFAKILGPINYVKKVFIQKMFPTHLCYCYSPDGKIRPKEEFGGRALYVPSNNFYLCLHSTFLVVYHR